MLKYGCLNRIFNWKRDIGIAGNTSKTIVEDEEKFWESHDEFDWLTYDSVAHVMAQCPQPKGRVLELCCGSGMFTRHINFRDVTEYVGLDIADSLIKKLKVELPHVTTVKGNAEAPDFRPESFDFIFVFAGLHHLPRMQICIENAFKLLKPGGTFCCFEPNLSCFGREYMLKLKWIGQLVGVVYTDDEIFLSPDSLNSDLKKVGFKQINTTFLTPSYKYYSTQHLLIPLVGTMKIVSMLPVVPRKLTQTFFISTTQK